MSFKNEIEQTYSCVMDETVENESIKERIEHCKKMVEQKIGLENETDLHDSFQFVFPIIGPLSKSEYLKQVKQFDLESMFPGMHQNLYYNFHIDPYDEYRVWFTSRLITTHASDGPFGKAKHKKIDCPPQMNSLTFDKDGKIKKYTGGYVMDRTIGNTGVLVAFLESCTPLENPSPFRRLNLIKKLRFALIFMAFCLE